MAFPVQRQSGSDKKAAARRLVTALLVSLVSLLLLQGLAWAREQEHGPKGYPNVFSPGSIDVPAGQTIGNLIVVQGNATVEGRVARGILVVDGNLVLKTGASVEGRIMVFSGQVVRESGAMTEKPVWNIAPPDARFTRLLSWIAVTGAIILLAGLGFVVWVAGRWLKAFSRYMYRKIGQYVPDLLLRRQAIYIAAGFGISALMLALFFAVAEETFLDREMDFVDSIVVWLVRHFASPGLDTIMIAITNIGSARFYGLFVPVILAGLAFFRRWREAASLAICLGGAAGLNFLLKHLFERARPDLFRVVEETGYSFPSGHAMVALCFYGMIVYLVGRSIASQRRRFGLYLLAGMFVTAIGVSRIYLGVHYPSDVLGAYAAGAMWLSFCISALAWYGL